MPSYSYEVGLDREVPVRVGWIRCWPTHAEPRSRVSFIMNNFRKLGFIEYNDTLEVHSSLPNGVLHDSPASTRG